MGDFVKDSRASIMKAARCLWAAGLLLVAISSQTARGEAATTAANPPVVESETASPWSWIKMPQITMPKITMPKMPADPFAPVKSSAAKVSDGAKKAWEGTKELFTFGGKKSEPTDRVASRPDQPSVWSRMFGGGEEKAPEGPQTVADWMAQPRVE
jgi:hypothetical protein